MKWNRRFALSLFLPLSVAVAGYDNSHCSPAPLTGCEQSDKVTFEVDRRYKKHGKDKLRFSWFDEKGMLPKSKKDGHRFKNVVLCVFDQSLTAQTETEAPSPGANSLTVEVGSTGSCNHRRGKQKGGCLKTRVRKGLLTASGENLDLSSLDSVEDVNTISQLQSADGTCFGASFSVLIRNAPPFPSAQDDTIDFRGIISEEKAKVALSNLVALYNERSVNAGQPLDMTLWSNALAASDIFNQIATDSLDEVDLESLVSALYVLGWYGGTLFARDGFQFTPGPPSQSTPDITLLSASLQQFEQGRELVSSNSGPAALEDLLTLLQRPEGFQAGGIGVRGLVESFGYNTGYAFAVLEDNINTFNPPPEKMSCSGITAYSGPNDIHPKLPNVAAGAPLFDCTFEPRFLESRTALRIFLEEYIEQDNTNVADLPDYLQPIALKAAQDTQEGVGQFVWTQQLAFVIRQEQEYRESLWDIDNAFLEIVEAAALLGMGALTRADDENLARTAVLAATAYQGWLIAYRFGLTAPSGPEPYSFSTDPRVIPMLVFGVTPTLPYVNGKGGKGRGKDGSDDD